MTLEKKLRLAKIRFAAAIDNHNRCAERDELAATSHASSQVRRRRATSLLIANNRLARRWRILQDAHDELAVREG